MFRFPAKIPVIFKRLFPNYVWDFSSITKTIYLTFDDGPTPEVTNWALQQLKPYNAKATFFCIGNNIEKHPDIFRQIITEGHHVGNHTHNHLKGWKTSSKLYLENVLKCDKVMSNELKVQSAECGVMSKQSPIKNHHPPITNLFRPPYGQITPQLGKQLIRKGYKIIMWDVIAYDWDNSITSETCLNNILNNAVDGSIIVLHDSIKASQHLYYALPKVLTYFSEKGYQFKAIS